MKTKWNVKLFGLQLPMRIVLVHADRIYRKYGRELVITSTVDGVHSPGSLHPFGYAVDLRTKYFEPSTAITVTKELQDILGKDYQVLFEKDHIHVEYQAILDRGFILN